MNESRSEPRKNTTAKYKSQALSHGALGKKSSPFNYSATVLAAAFGTGLRQADWWHQSGKILQRYRFGRRHQYRRHMMRPYNRQMQFPIANSRDSDGPVGARHWSTEPDLLVLWRRGSTGGIGSNRPKTGSCTRGAQEEAGGGASSSISALNCEPNCDSNVRNKASR